jgi:Uma2 family endonuclease
MAADPKDSPRHYYTLEEYFALERTGDGRYEYWDGEIVSMSGGSKEHGRIAGNIYFGLRQQIADRGCEVFNSEKQERRRLFRLTATRIPMWYAGKLRLRTSRGLTL